MSTINGRACVVNGKAVDKVFSNGRQVYGRNLLPDTNNTLTTSTTGHGWVTGLPSYELPKPLEANQTYTLSCYLEPVTHDVCVCMGTITNGNVFGTTVTAGSKGISTLTITFTQEEAAASHYCWVTFTHKQTDTSTVSSKGFKFENGNVATPWTPAPEDVM